MVLLARRPAACENGGVTPERIDEAFALLDRGALAEVARSGPPCVFATVSGAHLYGFASKDSDVDLRGAFLLGLREVLSLDPPDETRVLEPAAGTVDARLPPMDFVAHDLRKFCRMMVSHNGYALEQLFSPLVVVSTPTFEALRALGRGCITRPLVRHYLGFARGRRKRLGEPDPTVKHALYAYRVFLSGIHCMRTGDVEANLGDLADRYPSSRIDELVHRKREGGEALRLSPDDLGADDAALAALEAELHRAHEESRLPDEPTTRREIDGLVVEARVAAP